MKFRIILKNIFYTFGLSIIPLDKKKKLITQNIGLKSANEVFTYYIKHKNNFSKNKLLENFIKFYLDNWENSSSQWSQDIFVMFMTNLKQKGKFIEIGSSDGFTHSNTISLNEKLNWSGILIEPNRDLFKLLKIIRFSDKLLNVAISPTGKEKNLTLKKFGPLSFLEGFNGDDFLFSTREKSNEKQKVKAINLSNLLLKDKFDYLSLDVEGAELMILETLNWSKIFKPSIITVEYNWRKNDKDKIKKILLKEGYIVCFEDHNWLTRGDLWFVLENLKKYENINKVVNKKY